jgi:hypothetical protein
MKNAYPILNKALAAKAFAEHTMKDEPEAAEYDPRAQKILRKAVDAERERLKDFRPAPATTEHGKALQREFGGSKAYIDAIVEHGASKRLNKYKPGKNVKPS